MPKSQDFAICGNYTLVPLHITHLHLQVSRFWTTSMEQNAHQREPQYKKTKRKITEVREKIHSVFKEKKNKSVTIETNVVITFIQPLFCFLCWEKGTGFKQ